MASGVSSRSRGAGFVSECCSGLELWRVGEIHAPPTPALLPRLTGAFSEAQTPPRWSPFSSDSERMGGGREGRRLSRGLCCSQEKGAGRTSTRGGPAPEPRRPRAPRPGFAGDRATRPPGGRRFLRAPLPRGPCAQRLLSRSLQPLGSHGRHRPSRSERLPRRRGRTPASFSP